MSTTIDRTQLSPCVKLFIELLLDGASAVTSREVAICPSASRCCNAFSDWTPFQRSNSGEGTYGLPVIQGQLAKCPEWPHLQITGKPEVYRLIRWMSYWKLICAHWIWMPQSRELTRHCSSPPWPSGQCHCRRTRETRTPGRHRVPATSGR
jgi:hypothetical protein